MIKEANICAKELQRDVVFDLKLEKELPDWVGAKIGEDLKKSKTEMKFQVKNHENGTHYAWSESKFGDRVEVIRDIINTYLENGKIPV